MTNDTGARRELAVFLAGQFLSMAGIWAAMLAIAWAVWGATGSPLWLGAVGFATQVPALFAGPLGGVAADRFGRRATIATLSLACALMLAALGAALSRAEVAPWSILAGCLCLGAATALAQPVQQAFIMDLSGKDRVLGATSASTALYHAGRFLGPALAGLVIVRFGAPWCLFVGAASFALFAASLSLLKTRGEPRGVRRNASMREDLAEGLRAFRREPKVALAVITAVVLSGVGMQFATLMPVFADQRFGGAASLGGLRAATAVGSFAAATWLARSRKRDLMRLALLCALGFSALIMAFSQVTRFSAAIAVLSGAGFLFTAAFSSLAALVQLCAPESLRGRMMGLFMAAFMGAAPIAHLAAGFAAEAFGAARATLGSAAFCFAACAAIMWRYRASGAIAQASSEELSAET